MSLDRLFDEAGSFRKLFAMARKQEPDVEGEPKRAMAADRRAAHDGGLQSLEGAGSRRNSVRILALSIGNRFLSAHFCGRRWGSSG
jgi:hypothetical protein